MLDTLKAKQGFGFEPKMSLEEGIAKTITWYKENFV
jgi:nucleoside-diphosphate-sugar epimerase